jgi:hypothetical protein
VRSYDRARHDGSMCGSVPLELAFGAESRRSAPPDKALLREGNTTLEARPNRVILSRRIATSLRVRLDAWPAQRASSPPPGGVALVHRTEKKREKDTEVGAYEDSRTCGMYVLLQWKRCCDQQPGAGRTIAPALGATQPCPRVTCIHRSHSSLLPSPPFRGCVP